MTALPPKIRIQGARSKGYPDGYVVGRVSTGTGDLELLGVTQLRQLGLAGRNELIERTQNAGFGFFAGGVLDANENLGSGALPFTVTFRDGNPLSFASSLTPAAASATFRLVADVAGTPTDVGTIVFAMGSTSGVVSWVGGEFVLAPGQVFSVIAPNPADATLASVTGTITGTK